MKRITLIYLLLTCLAGGCSQTGGVTRELRTAASPVARESPQNRQGAQSSALQKQIEETAALAKGRVGVAAVLLETNQRLVSLNSPDHFPMQSVYKLPISMAVMKLIDAGKITLDQKVRISKEDYIGRDAHSPIRDKNPNGAELSVTELLRFALSESDGTASDVLMKLAGGSQSVQAYLADLGIKDLKVVDTEKSFVADHSLQFRNWATPDAAVELLRALHERRGLTEASQGLLVKYLIESTPGANRLKGLLPPGTIVAHKTGTSGTEKGITAATNDIGVVTLPNGNHLAIAVFVSDSSADIAVREGVIAKICKAVWDSQTK